MSGWTAYTVEFSPDSRMFVTASGDGNLDLWDVPARKHLRRLVGVLIEENGLFVRRGLARFLHNGDLAYLDPSGAVAFFDREARKSIRLPIVRGKAKALRLTTDPTGRSLAVGWDDGHIELRDGDTGAQRRSFAWNGSSNFALSPNGEWLALADNEIVSLVPTNPKGRPFDLQQKGSHFSMLAFSPDGAKVAAVEGRAVLVWDLASRQQLLRLSGHKESITAVAFSPDGSLIATSCGDAMTRIFDAYDGRPLTSVPGPWYMESLAFSPDGASLAASAGTSLVCLYQLEGRREQRRLIGHQYGVLRLVFHPSLPRLASASNDHAVILWDAESARKLVRSVAHKVYVTGLAISPDGTSIASIRGDGYERDDDFSIRLTDPASGVLQGRLAGNTKGVRSLAFDQTGRRIASGDTAGTVLLFDVQTGKLLRHENLENS